MTTGLDDEELLGRTPRDPASFEPLVERHSAALHGYFARRAPTAVDDLLAELWLQAYATRRGFDPARGSVRAWLFGVARNVLSAHWRRVAAARQDLPRAIGDDDLWEAVDNRLVAAGVAPRLRELLAQLRSDERELLLLVTRATPRTRPCCARCPVSGPRPRTSGVRLAAGALAARVNAARRAERLGSRPYAVAVPAASRSHPRPFHTGWRAGRLLEQESGSTSTRWSSPAGPSKQPPGWPPGSRTACGSAPSPAAPGHSPPR
ncbi:RNA polymerase sigma factor [Streptomyces avermitilis]|uniref:RNA polymerase sigma factor n=1 Tax=Streptomyces avermitilis TaxID=33903 RepID=UPI00380DF92C